jgi:hypothetical protein
VAYDDVREVFLNDAAFRAPYKDKLDIIMGGHRLFLSMDDTPEYRRDKAPMRLVVRPADSKRDAVCEIINVHQPLIEPAHRSARDDAAKLSTALATEARRTGHAG